MSILYYQDQELFIENTPLQVIAKTFGTPCYIYSRAAILHNWLAYQSAFQPLEHLVCYAVKANSNLTILNLLVKLGAGFDIVSGGELARVLAVGGDPQKIFFSGVGKTHAEIETAIKKNIFCFDIESAHEIERIAYYATHLNKKINIALRVNPNIDAETHAHISTGLNENKFGIEQSEVLTLAKQIKAHKHLNLIGIACHIGSQLTSIKPFINMLDWISDLYLQLYNHAIPITHLNIGGGLGIIYHDENPPTIHEYASIVKQKLGQLPVKVIIEPGRSLIGNAGVLLTRVEYIKHNGTKNFAIVDAGMNDLLRPALYDAWQNILPVKQRRDSSLKSYDIVGPVCESADFLGKNRQLAVAVDDLLAIDCAGAYGFSMSSNYNSRPRGAEILIDEDKIHLIRRRESIESLFDAEQIIIDHEKTITI